MKIIRLEESGRLVRADTDAPGQPGAGEALVRVHRIGVCGTDIHAFGVHTDAGCVNNSPCLSGSCIRPPRYGCRQGDDRGLKGPAT